MANLKFSFWLKVTFLLAIGCLAIPVGASAEIAFVSASDPSTALLKTVDSDGQQVFVFKDLADEETSDLIFSIDSECPLVAMTGGAKFNGSWTCEGGQIAVSVTNKGGMTFGPKTDEPDGSFYVTFSDPPPAPGTDTPPEQLAGIQISLYGDIQSWSLTGEVADAGVSFGVELSGPEGGEAHFLMDLPPTAVEFLGNVIGVSVGGKADPFATVTNNEDGSVAVAVDIPSLKSGTSSSRVHSALKTITKKITAGPRVLGVAAKKTTAKPGTSVTYAMCAGQDFSAGDKIPLAFSIGGKTKSNVKGNFKLDSSGCDTASVKLDKSISGTLVAKIKYKGKKASTSLKVQK